MFYGTSIVEVRTLHLDATEVSELFRQTCSLLLVSRSREALTPQTSIRRARHTVKLRRFGNDDNHLLIKDQKGVTAEPVLRQRRVLLGGARRMSSLLTWLGFALSTVLIGCALVRSIPDVLGREI